MSLSRKHARLIVEAFEIDFMITFDNKDLGDMVRKQNPELFEAYTAIVAFANDSDSRMTDDEILVQLDIQYGSELSESFYECLEDPDDNATALNKWMKRNGFALRVKELIDMDDDGCCVWRMKETT